MEQLTRIGMDTSKHIFQLHGVNAVEAPSLGWADARKQTPGTIAMGGKRTLAGRPATISLLRIVLGSCLKS